MAEQYGKSPAIEAIKLIKQWNALPIEEKVYISARRIEERLKMDERK